MAANPVLNDAKFDQIIEANYGTGASAPTRVMTLGGTLSAFGVLLTLLLVGAAFGWSQVEQSWITVTQPDGSQVLVNNSSLPGWTFIAMLVALGFALVTAFKPKVAMFTAPIYALTMGGVLGVISAYYNQQWDGIVAQAVCATLGVVFAVFVLYATRIVKVTQKFVMITVAATFGVMFMYLFGWILSLFTPGDVMFLQKPSALSIGLSLVIIVVGAMNLFVDFAFIETSVKAGDVPRSMEWYAAFGVTVTIVWLYMEILRLLSLLRR
jgi:uncharacterized YccA/Bax inhibitor family protein